MEPDSALTNGPVFGQGRQAIQDVLLNCPLELHGRVGTDRPGPDDGWTEAAQPDGQVRIRFEPGQVGQRGPHPAAAVVAAHDDVGNTKLPDREFDRRANASVRV